jgi:hypothetical protein
MVLPFQYKKGPLTREDERDIASSTHLELVNLKLKFYLSIKNFFFYRFLKIHKDLDSLTALLMLHFNTKDRKPTALLRILFIFLILSNIKFLNKFK